MESEARERQVETVEGQWCGQVEVRVYEAKSFWHDTNDFARLRIDHDVSPDDRGVSTKPSLPISIAQNRTSRTLWFLIDWREPASERRAYRKRLENAIAHRDGADLFWFGYACYVRDRKSVV